MELSLQKRFQLEAVESAEGLSALQSRAATLVQTGGAEEAIALYRSAQLDLQAFHDKWDAALQSDDPAFAAWWRQHVSEQKADLLMLEGIAFRWVGKLDEAGALFERALALTPAGTSNHASLIDGLGGIQYDRQSFAKAEEFFLRAHEEFVSLAAGAANTEPDSAVYFWSQAAQELVNAAHAALGRGGHADFEKFFDAAVGLAERHGLVDLANKLWLQQARYLLASDASGETLQRVKSERNRRRSQSANPEFQLEGSLLLAESCREQGMLDLAREELEEAREIAPPQRQWNLLRQLADITETQGDIQAALDYAQEALASARQTGMPKAVVACLRALVSLHAENNPGEAERYLSEVRASGEMDEIKNALLARSTVYCKQKRYELAMQDLDEAERATPGDAGVLLARVAVLRGMDAKEEALRVIEHATAAFREQVRQSGADWRSGLDSLAALHEVAAFLAAELGRAEEAFAWAENGKTLRLRSRFIAPTDERTTPEINFSELRERLRAESAALLFFCVTHRSTLALLCDPKFDKPRSFFIELTEQSLSGLLPEGLQGDGPWNAAVFNALRTLSEKLAPCLMEAIGRKENRTLYIVPDSRLYFVPFAALDLDSGSKVIDHCAVVYLPCAALLLSRPRADTGSRTCLSVGAGREQEFSFSEQAWQIARVGWDASECLAEASADEFLQKAPHFNVLHLQCHGRMEGSLPGTRSASTLVLADRRVSAKDVYGLTLTAELVFLNACVSGRFQSRVSSEVGGFWEAFLHAGASEIIVTLAYVHPESAQRLALAFYRHWLDGKSSSEALRQAQLELREERPEPVHWATHILIG